MLTKEQKIQFNEILEELGQTLDISESEYNAAVKSYQAVGAWLSKEDSELAPYKPNILPQGSFLFGTMIKPINPKDDLDIDLVCELTGKKPTWTQADLKKIVGDQLKKNDTYKEMLDKEGRRCWTLKYRENSDKNDKYHLDILPSIISDGYSIILEKAFSDADYTDFDKIALRITDNTFLPNYYIDTNIANWYKSNPFGYGIWFEQRASLALQKAILLSESVKPVPTYHKEKLPLQRVIQILKRHRDMMFNGHADKPISIIITTLAARAYNKQANVIDALVDVINNMHLYIEEKMDYTTFQRYKFVGNPVNNEENFADKWRTYKQKETNFYNWLAQVKKDIAYVTLQRGTYQIQESLSKAFGETEVAQTFKNIGNRAKLMTEQGNNRFDSKLGIIATGANVIKPHNFFGNE